MDSLLFTTCLESRSPVATLVLHPPLLSSSSFPVFLKPRANPPTLASWVFDASRGKAVKTLLDGLGGTVASAQCSSQIQAGPGWADLLSSAGADKQRAVSPGPALVVQADGIPSCLRLARTGHHSGNSPYVLPQKTVPIPPKAPGGLSQGCSQGDSQMLENVLGAGRMLWAGVLDGQRSPIPVGGEEGFQMPGGLVVAGCSESTQEALSSPCSLRENCELRASSCSILVPAIRIPILGCYLRLPGTYGERIWLGDYSQDLA
ncbi:hypothetical protein CB1_018820003 [Camelus ferus]|nr:hypothetical protein CB1_018820003 [Camelus ferus]